MRELAQRLAIMSRLATVCRPVLFGTLLLFLTVACGRAASELTVQLAEQESSGQTGTAILTVKGEQI
jgi:hypothetical protein